jgi:hypothetical protein
MQSSEIAAINGLFASGVIDQRTTLELLRRGEIIPDEADIDEIISGAEAEQMSKVERELDQQGKALEIAAALDNPQSDD